MRAMNIKDRVNTIIEHQREVLRGEIEEFEEKLRGTMEYWGCGGPYNRQEEAIERRKKQLDELDDFAMQLNRAKKHETVRMWIFGCRSCGSITMVNRQPFDDWHECPVCRQMVHLNSLPSKEFEMLKAHEEGEAPTWKEVREAKRTEPEEMSESDTLPGQMEYPKDYEKPEDKEEFDQEEEQEQEEEWEQAHPESITSLCYSCQRYADCNVKTGTCENCDQYVNKAEAEKTDEQRYDEEQAAIDRETARKLREQEQEEKMNNLPSDNKEEKEYIRLSTDTFEDVIAGRRPYLILKNDKIRTGMIVSALEFMQGRATGRELALEIVCMDDAGTSSALEDGYCVVGIRQQEVLKEAGADAAEYADQPAMQYGA